MLATDHPTRAPVLPLIAGTATAVVVVTVAAASARRAALGGPTSLAPLRPLLDGLIGSAGAVVAGGGAWPLLVASSLAAAAAGAWILGSPRIAVLGLAAAGTACGRAGNEALGWVLLAAAAIMARRGVPRPGAGEAPSPLVQAGLLSVFVAVACVLRFERIEILPEFPIDEPVFGLAAAGWATGDTPKYIHGYDAGFFGGFWPSVLLTSWFFRTVGIGFVEARILSAILGVATTIVVFAAGRRLSGAWSGLWGAAIYAISPIPIAIDRIGLPYALSMLHAASALWVISWSDVWSRARSLVAGALAGLSIALYQASWFLPVVIPASIAILHPRAARRFSTWAWWAVSAAVVSALQLALFSDGFVMRLEASRAVGSRAFAGALATFDHPPGEDETRTLAAIAGEHSLLLSRDPFVYLGRFRLSITGRSQDFRAAQPALERAGIPLDFASSSSGLFGRLGFALRRIAFVGAAPDDVALPSSLPLVPPLFAPLLVIGIALTRSRADGVLLLWSLAGFVPGLASDDPGQRRLILLHPALDLLLGRAGADLKWPLGRGARALSVGAVAATLAFAIGTNLDSALLTAGRSERVPASPVLRAATCLNGTKGWRPGTLLVTDRGRPNENAALDLATWPTRPKGTQLAVTSTAEFRSLPAKFIAGLGVLAGLRGSEAAAVLYFRATQFPSARLYEDDCLVRIVRAPE